MPNSRPFNNKCAILQSKGREKWRVPLRCNGKKTVYTIGRHPNCSLVLSDMHISSKHLTICCRYETNSNFKNEGDDDSENGDGDESEDPDQIVIELTDTSSNGTWLNGEKLERGRPVLLENGFEVSFPCDEPLQADYTFIIHIPSKEDYNEQTDTSCKAASIGYDGRSFSSHGYDATHANADSEWKQQFSEQWKELRKQENELILNVSRLAARIYVSDDAIVKNQEASAQSLEQENEMPIPVDENTTPTVSLKEFETGMDELLLANKYKEQVLKIMLDSMKSARNQVLLSESMTEDDRESILEKLDISRWDAVMRSINQ